MHVLFATRKFPPATGGMETLAYDTYRALIAAGCRVTLIKKGGADWHHVWWIPMALWQLARVLRRDRPDVVLLGDATANLGAVPVIRLFRVPHATMVMGLDVTLDSSIYRKIAVRHLRWTPLIMAISSATAGAVRAAGVPPEQIRVLRLSVSPPSGMAPRAEARAALRERYGVPDDAVVLTTVGRLVKRKGVAWLISKVLPRLNRPFVYLVAGGGSPRGRARIERAIQVAGLADRVRLLGRVTEDERELLLRGADLFVQPNIHVYGDMEGFGLVNVEAAVRDLPVLAADIEGIPDAVDDGRTGWLLPSADVAAWRTRLQEVTADLDELVAQGEAFGKEARDRYSPQQFAEVLVTSLTEVAARGRNAGDLADDALSAGGRERRD